MSVKCHQCGRVISSNETFYLVIDKSKILPLPICNDCLQKIPETEKTPQNEIEIEGLTICKTTRPFSEKNCITLNLKEVKPIFNISEKIAMKYIPELGKKFFLIAKKSTPIP